MATLTLVNIGAAPDDGNGDAPRTAFNSINGSLTALNNELVTATALSIANESDIAGLGALSALDTVATALIEGSAVTFAKIQDIPTARVLGRVTAATGVVEELTAAQIRTLLNVADGATAITTAADLAFVPDGSIAATNVQGAIQEVRDEAVGGSSTAAGTTFTPDGSIAATDVQAAIVEVRDEAALATHNHTLADVTDAGTAAAVDTGTGSANAILGNDARLTDARTPTAHTHTLADVTDSGALAALGTVDAAEIEDGAVGSAKIAAGAITRPKLAARSIDAQVDTAHALTTTDRNGVVTMDNASANTVTIDLNATTALSTGFQCDIAQLGAGVTTIDAVAGVTLNGVDGGSTAIQARHGAATVLKLGTDDWLVFGNIAVVA